MSKIDLMYNCYIDFKNLAHGHLQELDRYTIYDCYLDLGLKSETVNKIYYFVFK